MSRQAGLSRPLVLTMAAATGVAVANLYYAQPLLAAMSADLGLSPTAAGLIVTVSQAGYAAGLIFLLPLGDLVERRRLSVVLAVCAAAALVWQGSAPSGAVLLPAAVAVGALSVQAQVLVPFAASLAPEGQRGRVVGTVMSGLLLGILLARTVSGYLAQAGGWRVVYFTAAGAMLVQALALRRALPSYREQTRASYPRLLASVAAIVREEPLLRLRAAYGALGFACFSVLWTSLAFLLAGPAYRLGTGTIGLFGLAGAAGAVIAGVAGRLADRGRAGVSTAVGVVLLAASWAAIAAGADHLWALLAGIVVLDIAVQGLQITNQSEIYRLRPDARSRITSAYMTLYFAGGAAGSAASAAAWDAGGWAAVSWAGAGFGVLAVAVWVAASLTARRARGAGRAHRRVAA